VILYFKESSAILQNSYPQTHPHTDHLDFCPVADNSPSTILPYITQKLNTCIVNGNNTHYQYYFEVVDIGHSKLQNNTTGHRTWEAFIGFCDRETVKMTSIMCNNLFKSWQLCRW